MLDPVMVGLREMGGHFLLTPLSAPLGRRTEASVSNDFFGSHRCRKEEQATFAIVHACPVPIVDAPVVPVKELRHNMA